MSQPRINVPVRAPRIVHTILRESADRHGMTIAAYLESLCQEKYLEQIDPSGGTFLNPRTSEAEVVAAIAEFLGKRQWEIWLELHRLHATSESDD